MFGPVKSILRFNYHYGRFIGVVNFEVDAKTGRAKLTRDATIYAAIVNLLIFSLVPLMVLSRFWSVAPETLNHLHQYVFLVVMFIRILCVFITLLGRWWHRQQIVELFNSFRQFVLEQPRVMRLWRRGVISKCITGTLTESFHVVLALNGLRQSLTLGLALGAFLLYIIIALINVFLGQYYFALLNIHGHYILFNQDLRSIMAETQALQLDRRKGVSVLKSCALADRLDRLASLQSQLQSLVTRTCDTFGLQNVCICIICYLTSIAGYYFCFLGFKYNLLNLNLITWNNCLLLLCILSYLVDMHLTYTMPYNVQDLHAEMVQLLGQFTTFAPGLDVRLEVAFESFQLQLVRNPFQLSVMGLRSMRRGVLLSMFNSMISYSLFLIQFDIENY